MGKLRLFIEGSATSKGIRIFLVIVALITLYFGVILKVDWASFKKVLNLISIVQGFIFFILFLLLIFGAIYYTRSITLYSKFFSFIIESENKWMLVGSFVAISAVATPIIIFKLSQKELSITSLGDLGTVGDFLGGTTVGLLSLASILFLISNLIMQRKELTLTRDELDKANIQYKLSNETMFKQQFETTFFNLVNLSNQLKNDISYTTKTLAAIDKHPKYIENSVESYFNYLLEKELFVDNFMEDNIAHSNNKKVISGSDTILLIVEKVAYSYQEDQLILFLYDTFKDSPDEFLMNYIELIKFEMEGFNENRTWEITKAEIEKIKTDNYRLKDDFKRMHKESPTDIVRFFLKLSFDNYTKIEGLLKEDDRRKYHITPDDYRRDYFIDGWKSWGRDEFFLDYGRLVLIYKNNKSKENNNKILKAFDECYWNSHKYKKGAFLNVKKEVDESYGEYLECIKKILEFIDNSIVTNKFIQKEDMKHLQEGIEEINKIKSEKEFYYSLFASTLKKEEIILLNYVAILGEDKKLEELLIKSNLYQDIKLLSSSNILSKNYMENLDYDNKNTNREYSEIIKEENRYNLVKAITS